MSSSSPNIHEGHRKRLRERYQRSGMDDFAPHEVMELLLTYVIPRKDVNPLAHTLIGRFGTVARVMDATVEELCEVDGIGLDTAYSLKMFPDLFRRYELDRCDTGAVYDTVAKVGDYLHALYTGVEIERVYALFFDNKLQMIDRIHLHDGSVNCSQVTVRRIAEEAFRKKAAAVVLAHNHPHGLAIPSGADVQVTQNVECALETLGIQFLEHLVVTENSYATILRQQRGLLRSSPRTGEIDRKFYERYYGEE